MDADLKAYLDALRQDLTQQIVESRQHAEQLNAETRQELSAQMAQLNAETRQELSAQMAQLNAETRQELSAQMAQLNAETRAELGTLIEAVHHEVRLMAEGVSMFNDRSDRLWADHERRIARLDQRLP